VSQPLLEGALTALLGWQAMSDGAYSENTLRAQKAEWSDLPGILRITAREVYVSGSEDHPRSSRIVSKRARSLRRSSDMWR
jgi:hypothetical protein